MDKMKRRTLLWQWGAIALFLLWLFFSLGSYYLVQKPLSVPQLLFLAEDRFIWQAVNWNAAALGRTLVDLLASIWLVLLAWGCGRWFLQRFPLTFSPLADATFSIALGWGVLGLLTLLFGALQLYQTFVFSLLAVLLTILAVPQLLAFGRTHRSQLVRLKFSIPRLVFVYIGLVLLLALTIALLPPTSWDGLFYHLKGPKLYLEAGGIVGGVDIPHLSFPSLLEMNFLLAMAWRGDTVAHLIHFSFIFLLVAIVILIAKEWLKMASARVAVLLLFTMPMFLNLATWAYNDLALAFYGAAALYLVGLWLQKPDGLSRLVLAGMMAGFAMSLKYTSLMIPLLLITFILWSCRRSWHTAWKPVLAFAIPAGLLVMPWLIKNWQLTGNPVYPFLFGGEFWNAYRAAAYAEAGTGIGFDLLAWVRLPYDLTIGLQDASQDGLTGPLFLAGLPLLLAYVFLPRLRTQLPSGFGHLLLFALGHYLFWMIGVISSGALWQSRLLLPAFVVLCPALAWIFEAVRVYDDPQFSLRRFLNIALGLVLTLALISQFLLWLPEAPWAYLLGDESHEANLQRRLGGHYEAMQWLNENLPDEAVVFFLWEPRSYYCNGDCRPDSILDRMGDWEYRYKDADGIAAAWRADGVTHLLLWRLALDFIVDQQAESGLYVVNQPLLTDLLDNHLTLLETVGGYEIYELQPPTTAR